jgi:taurine-pyruvate aminotransferase
LRSGHPEDQRINYFRDISTYGGCAGATVAALESTRIIEAENLVENSRVVGAYMLESCRRCPTCPWWAMCAVWAVLRHRTGKGQGHQTAHFEAEMGRIMGLVAAEGVLIGRTNSSLPGNNTIMNFAPALIATKADIDEIVAAVKKAIEKYGFLNILIINSQLIILSC